jgi:hypothetical protein
MMVMTPMQHEGKEINAIRTTTKGQQGQYNAHAILAMAPVQQGQWCHSYNGKDACALTMVMTPLWQGWGHQLEDLIHAIAARETRIFWQWHRCLDCKDACASMTATPSQWGQWPQLDNSKDACALMAATTPLLWGQQHQLDDYAILTVADKPSQQGQELPSQWRQRCLHINGNNAIKSVNHHRNNGEDARASTATMPSQQGQQCQLYDKQWEQWQ